MLASVTHSDCAAPVSAAQCEPVRYAPPISPVSKHGRTKRPVAAPAGIDLLSCVLARRGHTGAARSSISSTWLIRRLWAAANGTGPSPVCRPANQPTDSETTQRPGAHSDPCSYFKLGFKLKLFKSNYWLLVKASTFQCVWYRFTPKICLLEEKEQRI